MSTAAQVEGKARYCADCGTFAPGRHCPACGQKTALDRTLGSMVHGLVHDLTHIDGKLWRTLPLLVTAPGVLTRRYIDGQRTRYVGPNVIFLGSAFLMFLSFNLLPAPQPAPVCKPTQASAVQRVSKAVRGDLERVAPELEALLPEAPPKDVPPVARWLEGHVSPTFLASLEQALADPAALLGKVKQKAYKMGFLLVPLSLPALWLLVGRRPGVKPYDLAVFALYSIGFMSFLLTAVMLLAGSGFFAWQLCLALLLTIPPVHFYLHLRGCFALSPGETLWRAAALCVIATISLGFYLALVLVWGVLA